MDSPETPLNLRIYASRYKTLLVELVREKASSKIMSNTITFLNQLRGCAIDISDDEPQKFSESPTQITTPSCPATANIAYSIPASTPETSNSSPATTFTINSSTENGFLNKLKSCSVDLSRDNLSLSIFAPAPEEIGAIKNGKCLPSPSPPIVSKRTINIRILTSNSDATVSENEDTVNAEVEPKLEGELEEMHHFMNMESCNPRSSSPEDEEEVKRETEDCTQNEVIGPTQICEVCTEEIPSKDIYEHMYSHVGDFAYKCPNPRYNYTFLTRYSVAFLTHRLKGGLCWKAANQQCDLNVCEQCSQSNFPGTLQFGLHLKTHEISSAKNFLCPLKPCQEGFTLKQSLEYHLHTSHDPHLRKESQSELLKRVKPSASCRNPEEIQQLQSCKFCPLFFPNKEDLIQHFVIHCKEDGIGIPCDICPDTKETLFYYEYTIKQHYYNKHGIGKKLICQFQSCKFSCFTQSRLNRHLFIVHKLQSPGKYICKSCPLDFRTKRGLLAHNIKLHGAEPFRCGRCPRTFSSLDARHHHEKIHHDAIIFQQTEYECSHCQKKFSCKKSLHRHIEIQHDNDNKRLKCTSCSRSFKYGIHLRRHQRSHLPVGDREGKKRKYKCSYSSCEKSYHSMTYLHMHMKFRHFRLPGDHVCDVCGKRYQRPIQLRQHQFVHTGERPHECHICGQRFRRRDTLRKHLRSKLVHKDMEKLKENTKDPKGEKIHKCQICGKVFRFFYTLKKHKLGHHENKDVGKGDERVKVKLRNPRIPFERDSKTGKRRYKCSSCEKSFGNPFLVRKHIKYHHEGMEGDYVCEICGKRFVQSGGLKQHKRIHTGERPYQCHICGQVFRASSALTKHLRSKSLHNNQVELSSVKSKEK